MVSTPRSHDRRSDVGRQFSEHFPANEHSRTAVVCNHFHHGGACTIDGLITIAPVEHRDAWMAGQEPTEKKIACLWRLGDAEPVPSKLEISRLIDQLTSGGRGTSE